MNKKIIILGVLILLSACGGEKEGPFLCSTAISSSSIQLNVDDAVSNNAICSASLTFLTENQLVISESEFIVEHNPDCSISITNFQQSYENVTIEVMANGYQASQTESFDISFSSCNNNNFPLIEKQLSLQPL